MLLSNDAASVGIERCSAGDFYKPAHGHIFGAIRALMERGEAIDAVTVTDELKRSGVMEAVGDPSIFISLQANTPSIANARHYAAIVEEHSLLRRLIGVAGEIADIGYSVPEDVKAAVDEAEQLVFNVGERRTADTMRPLHELLGQGLDRIEELGQRGSHITGVATGYHELDRILLGLQPSTLNIVGARPGMGKTSFALGRPGQRRDGGAAAGAAVLAGDGPPGADPAPPGLGGRGQRAEPADGADPHPGLEQDRDGGDPAVRRADLHRRQPERDGHGHPGPGAAAEEVRGRPGHRRRRLPAADDGAGPGREPPERGGRDQPRPQDPGPRARGARSSPSRSCPGTSSPARTRRRSCRTCASRARSSRTPTSSCSSTASPSTTTRCRSTGPTTR